MAFSEWMRSRILVRAGVRFDEQLSTRVFNSSFESYLTQSSASPSRAFGDLIALRQFITGQGIFAFFDAPWAPIYLAVTFFLHPMLGWIAVVFAVIQGFLAWFGHRRTVEPSEAAAQAGSDAQSYLQSKLRNIEVIESMGMLGSLRKRWRIWQDAYLAAERKGAERQRPRDGHQQVRSLQPAVPVARGRRAAGDRRANDARRDDRDQPPDGAGADADRPVGDRLAQLRRHAGGLPPARTAAARLSRSATPT